VKKSSPSQLPDVSVGVITGAVLAVASFIAGENSVLARDPLATGLVLLAGAIAEGAKLAITRSRGINRGTAAKLLLLVALITSLSFTLIEIVVKIVRYETMG